MKKQFMKDLPMYIAYLVERPDIYQSTGYVVKNHPHLKTKYFTSKKYTLEEKLIQAKEYLNSATDAVQRLNGDGSLSTRGLRYSPSLWKHSLLKELCILFIVYIRRVNRVVCKNNGKHACLL